jgi:hypothetical protein
MFIIKPKARKYFTLVTPETILYRWKRAIKDYWTYDKPRIRKKGKTSDHQSYEINDQEYENR